MTELSLWLDTYDDIYSDFDSRSYLKRRVSEDFIYELQNAFKYRKERVTDLVLLLPQEKRDEQNEMIIVASLKEFFTTHFGIHADRCKKKLKRGVFFGITGILLMALNSFASFRISHTFSLVALRVIAEPAGWFLLWASFDFLFYDWKDLKKERELFRELAELNIHFKAA